MQSIQCVRNTAVAHYDETFEVTANLGIDPKKTNQIVRGILMVLQFLENLTSSFLMVMANVLEQLYLLMDNMQKKQKKLVLI